MDKGLVHFIISCRLSHCFWLCLAFGHCFPQPVPYLFLVCPSFSLCVLAHGSWCLMSLRNFLRIPNYGVFAFRCFPISFSCGFSLLPIACSLQPIVCSLLRHCLSLLVHCSVSFLFTVFQCPFAVSFSVRVAPLIVIVFHYAYITVHCCVVAVSLLAADCSCRIIAKLKSRKVDELSCATESSTTRTM